MIDVLEALQHIDPSQLDYQEWVNVGMGLKKEGCTADDWETWSSPDPRHKNGECFRKWKSFSRTNGTTVGGGTIIEYAMRSGWRPHNDNNDRGYALTWDSIISDEGVVVDQAYLEPEDVFTEPKDENWDPVQELITYLETLFKPSEIVAYSTQTYEDENGRKSPTKGVYVRQAGDLIKELRESRKTLPASKTISNVFGTLDTDAGAWIRFNPFDGKGVKNENVTKFKYALVESDIVELTKQIAILKRMELPIAAMVYSGKKSIHAIVRVDAEDMQEYRQRVEYLYGICEKNGLKVDTQNKNPSRLSRMPGVIRGDHKQFLIATNIGQKSWDEWRDWIEEETDGLPEIENAAEATRNPPSLSPELISNTLRAGHKMLIAGPSKGGKSYALCELAISIGTGTKWLGYYSCIKGKVLYINLEIDRASCLHRFIDICDAMQMDLETGLKNVDAWNLRGNAIPMDKLAPKIIRRAQKKDYIAVIIDPIYKVITGDENSADQMAAFCNQFDKICNELKCSVIYCHHFAKGSQAVKKSVDRASGSGVFARDPDALLTVTELEMSPEISAYLDRMAQKEAIIELLNDCLPKWKKDIADTDDLVALNEYTLERLTEEQKGELFDLESAKIDQFRKISAWRIEATLREFPTPPPHNFWFRFPIHLPDEDGILVDAEIDSGISSSQRKRSKESRENRDKNKRQIREEQLSAAFEACVREDGSASISDLANYTVKNKQTIRNWVDASSEFERNGNGVIRGQKK